MCLVKYRAKNAGFASAPGPCYIIAIRGKETPFREAVIQEWRAVSLQARLSLALLAGFAGKKPDKDVVQAARVVHKATGASHIPNNLQLYTTTIIVADPWDICRVGVGWFWRGMRDTDQVLSGACRRMKGKDRSFWYRHVHRGVTHHSGWLPLMQRLRIIKKTSRADRLLQPATPDISRRTMSAPARVCTVHTSFVHVGSLQLLL